MRTAAHLVVLGAVLVLAACGGRRGGGGGGGDDDDAASCDFAACGGDPVGEWRIADSCVTYDTSPPEDCPEADASYGTVDMSGTMSLDADGTYSLSTSMSFDVTIDFPTSCLGGATCDQIEQNLVLSFPGSSCQTSAQGCACTSPFDESSDETGTWEADGGTLRVVDQGGDPTDLDLCATGGSLQLRSASEGGGTIEMILQRM